MVAKSPTKKAAAAKKAMKQVTLCSDSLCTFNCWLLWQTRLLESGKLSGVDKVFDRMFETTNYKLLNKNSNKFVRIWVIVFDPGGWGEMLMADPGGVKLANPLQLEELKETPNGGSNMQLKMSSLHHRGLSTGGSGREPFNLVYTKDSSTDGFGLDTLNSSGFFKFRENPIIFVLRVVLALTVILVISFSTYWIFESPYYEPLKFCIGGTNSRRWIPIVFRSNWPLQANLNSTELDVIGVHPEDFSKDGLKWKAVVNNSWSLQECKVVVNVTRTLSMMLFIPIPTLRTRLVFKEGGIVTYHVELILHHTRQSSTSKWRHPEKPISRQY